MPNPVVGAGASLLGAREQRKAAKSATAAQERASQDAIEAQERALATLRQDLSPFTQFGAGLVPQAQSLFGMTQAAPQMGPFQSVEGAIPQAGVQVKPSNDIQSQIDQLRNQQSAISTASPIGRGPMSSVIPARERDAQSRNQQIEDQIRDLEYQMATQNQAGAPIASQAVAPQGFSADAGVQNLMSSPLFSSLLERSQEDVLQRAAVGGRLGTTGTQEALQDAALRTGFGLLQSERGQLLDAIRLGQSSAAQQAAAGTNTAAGIGNLLTGLGNAQAAGAVQQGNIRTGLIGDLAGAGGLLIEDFRGRTPPLSSPGSTSADYTSDAFRDWVANQ